MRWCVKALGARVASGARGAGGAPVAWGAVEKLGNDHVPEYLEESKKNMDAHRMRALLVVLYATIARAYTFLPLSLIHI